jgi:hypothetical protein
MGEQSTATVTEFSEELNELTALLRAGGFWSLAPAWVPRDGYAEGTPELLRRLEAGLRRALS